ncbi:hypothetical protein [Cellulomonas sp. Marseille-Q8402]
MNPFRTPHVAAEVTAGFHAAEARALQTALVGVLAAAERATGRTVPVDLVVDAGRGDALVVLCRNQLVGFVPEEHAPPLRARRAAAGRRARLVAPGLLLLDGATWRVWVGPEPEGGIPPVPDGLDTLPAPHPTILGVPLRRDDA